MVGGGCWLVSVSDGFDLNGRQLNLDGGWSRALEEEERKLNEPRTVRIDGKKLSRRMGFKSD